MEICMRYLGQDRTVMRGTSTGTEQYFLDDLSGTEEVAVFFNGLHCSVSAELPHITVPTWPKYTIKTVPSWSR